MVPTARESVSSERPILKGAEGRRGVAANPNGGKVYSQVNGGKGLSVYSA